MKLRNFRVVGMVLLNSDYLACSIINLALARKLVHNLSLLNFSGIANVQSEWHQKDFNRIVSKQMK